MKIEVPNKIGSVENAERKIENPLSKTSEPGGNFNQGLWAYRFYQEPLKIFQGPKDGVTERGRGFLRD